MLLKQQVIINTVFDGEICLVDENGNEDFQVSNERTKT